MVKLSLPFVELFATEAAQIKRPLASFQLQCDAVVFLGEDLVNAYLIEVDDTLWSFLVHKVLLCFVVFEHATAKNEIARLPAAEELARPLFLHLALVGIVFRQLVVYDRVAASRHREVLELVLHGANWLVRGRFLLFLRLLFWLARLNSGTRHFRN